jgi:hypothetical protein
MGQCLRQGDSFKANILKTVVPAIGRNDFPRRREPILTLHRGFR